MQAVGGRLRIVLLLISVLFGSGCRTSSEKAVDNNSRIIKTELFFGLSKADGRAVSESEWEKFVDEYITPKFGKGLTIVDAKGQWMYEKGKVIKEKTKIVILLHRDNNEASAAIEYIRDKYKVLFDQKEVLRVSSYIKCFDKL